MFTNVTANSGDTYGLCFPMFYTIRILQPPVGIKKKKGVQNPSSDKVTVDTTKIPNFSYSPSVIAFRSFDSTHGVSMKYR